MAVGIEPIRLHIHKQPNDCTASQYPYFCDYVKHVFEHTPGPRSVAAAPWRSDRARRRSRRRSQAAADARHPPAYVHAHEPAKVVGAEAVVQPGTGKVEATGGQPDVRQQLQEGREQHRLRGRRKYGGSHGFQAGSTFKLFVLTAALKEGIPLSTRDQVAGDPQGSPATGTAPG